MSTLQAHFRDLSSIDCLDVYLCTSVTMNEVLDGKIEEKKLELRNYLQVQSMLNGLQMADKVNTVLVQQELEATTQACSSTCDDVTEDQEVTNVVSW